LSTKRQHLDPDSAALLERLAAADESALDPELAGTPESIALRADLGLPLADRQLRARLYRDNLEARRPILVWLHGGGFAGGSLDDIDTTCTAIARRGSAIVLSLDYRLAPEHPFPDALNDTVDTLSWLSRHGRELGGDGRLAVGGQSAGGNLAAAASLLARERQTPPLEAQILCYPALDFSQGGASHTLFDGVLFNREETRRCYEEYLAGQPVTPLAAPLLADTLAGLPAALVVTAGSDPLRDDGRTYAARLRADGVPTQEVEYEGAIHAFLNFPGALTYAWQAIAEITGFLRMQLQPGPSPPPQLQHVTSLYDRTRADELRAFYGDGLGLREKPAPATFARAGIVWFDAGGHERELHFIPDDADAAIPHLCLNVPELDAITARLDRAGISAEHDDAIPGRPRVFVRDPFGNTVEIVSIRGPYAS
jgi:acetyl esterase